MEESRKQLSEQDVLEVLNQLGRTGKYSEDDLRLVRTDLQYGLSQEEVEVYLQKKIPFEVKRKLSEAFREGCGRELVILFADSGMNVHQIETAMSFFKEGATYEMIKAVIDQNLNAHGMKEAYKKLSEQLEKTCKDSNDTVLEELYQKLAYKDDIINNQQDIINQANSALARLRKELEEKEKEKEKMFETVEELKRQIAENKAEETEEKELEVSGDEKREKVSGIPMYCAVAYTPNGLKESTILYEKFKQRRTNFLVALSKMAFKKKSGQDIVKQVVNGKLNSEQLSQIRVGMEKHLTENQLQNLINNNISAEQMKEIIEIAVLENNM